MTERMLKLEEKVAYLERHVTEQDKAMLELAEDIAKLRRELLKVRDRITTTGTDASGDALPDDRPPHY